MVALLKIPKILSKAIIFYVYLLNYSSFLNVGH